MPWASPQRGSGRCGPGSRAFHVGDRAPGRSAVGAGEDVDEVLFATEETSSRSPGRRARLAVPQGDEGVLDVVALDDPVDAQRAQGRALQLRIAQGPREVGGRCRHATGQHGKIQGAKEWESHCRSTLMVLMDATFGASRIGQAAAINSTVRTRPCPASRGARPRGCRGRGCGSHEVRESPGNEILIPGRLETRMRRRPRPQMVDISG